MRVLHVGAEFFPLIKTGGLADVLGALPFAQKKSNSHANVRVLLPGYPAVKLGVANLTSVTVVGTFAGHMNLLLGEYRGLKIYVIDAPHLYCREGGPYNDLNLNDYPDNHLRFALLGWVACELACGLDIAWKAEIVHAHDWHAGLACAYLHAHGRPAKSVFTIHNLAFQGTFSSDVFKELHLPIEFNQLQGLEFYGQISFLKAGLFYADHVTTVSPTYAKEICLDEFGFGLQGLMQELSFKNKLTGILNGIDEEVWNPSSDNSLFELFDSNNLIGKAKNKNKLQKKLGLTETLEQPMFSIISRLAEQKGLDLVLQILTTIVEKGGQLVLLGTGDRRLQDEFLKIQSRFPQSVSIQIGYNDVLAHQIIASADVILVPSRFEPCGLTQLYGLKYGTLPLVRKTGGLADTVVDCSLENLNEKTATGFVFSDCTTDALIKAISRAFTLWKRKGEWKFVQTTAMAQNFSWNVSANEYFKLYKNLMK